MNMKSLSGKALILSAALVSAFLFSGCYTRLMMYQGEVTAEADSGSRGCSDCRGEVSPTGSREVCVWERDIFGYPDLRCYYTGYSSSWLYFHNTPWWYRSSYGWYDTRGCPPYYYYDRGTGRCRYYGGSYPGPNNGTGGSGGGGAAVGNRPRPQSRSVTSGSAVVEPAAASEGSPMFSGGANKLLSPVGAPVAPPAPATPPTPQPGSGSESMSKPHGGGGGGSPPPPEQKPPEQKPDKSERPRPSMRGM
jgi:hypothetical protein